MLLHILHVVKTINNTGYLPNSSDNHTLELPNILILLMPPFTTVLDVEAVVLCIPNSSPRTDHRGRAIECVLINLFTLHLLATGHFPSTFILIQCCIRSDTASIIVIIDVRQKILVSGNSFPIYVELSCTLDCSSLLRMQ